MVVGFWLLDIVATRVVVSTTPNEAITAQPDLMSLEIATALVDIVTAALAIAVVRLITTRQDRKNAVVFERLQGIMAAGFHI